jgi:hypothetical protein
MVIRTTITFILTLLVCGCQPADVEFDSTVLVWGRRGLDDGRFLKPRAITIDDQDRLYIVDMTSRIQVFDRDGNFIRSWRTPKCQQGKPCGLFATRIISESCFTRPRANWFLNARSEEPTGEGQANLGS